MIRRSKMSSNSKDILRQISPLADRLSLETYLKTIKRYYTDASKIAKSDLWYVNLIQPNIYVMVIEAVRLSEAYQKKKQTTETINVHALFGMLQDNPTYTVTINDNVNNLYKMIDAIPIGTKELTWKVKNEYARTINGMTKTFMTNLDSCTSRQKTVQKENIEIKNTINIISKTLTSTLNPNIVEKFDSLSELVTALVTYVNVLVEIIPFDSCDDMKNIFEELFVDSTDKNLFADIKNDVIQYSLYYFYGFVKFLSSSSLPISNDPRKVDKKNIFTIYKFLFDFIDEIFRTVSNENDIGGRKVTAATVMEIREFRTLLAATTKSICDAVRLSKDYKTSQEQLNTLRDQIVGYTETLRNSHIRNEQIALELTNFQTEYHDLKASYTNLRKQTAEYEKQIEILQQHCKEHTKKLEEVVNQLVQAKEKNRIINENSNQIEQELRSNLAEAKRDNDTLQVKLREIHDSYSVGYGQYKSMETQHDALLNEITELKQKYDDGNRDYEAMQKDNEWLFNTITALQDRYYNDSRHYEIVQRTNEMLNGEIVALQEKCSLIEQNYRSELQQLYITCGVLDKDNELLQKTNELEERNDLENMKITLQEYANTIQNLQREKEQHECTNTIIDEIVDIFNKVEKFDVGMELYVHVVTEIFDILKPYIEKKIDPQINTIWQNIIPIREHLNIKFVVNVSNEYYYSKPAFLIKSRKDVLTFIMWYQFVNNHLPLLNSQNQYSVLPPQKISIQNIIQRDIRTLIQNKNNDEENANVPTVNFVDYFLHRCVDFHELVHIKNRDKICMYLFDHFFIGPVQKDTLSQIMSSDSIALSIIAR